MPFSNLTRKYEKSYALTDCKRFAFVYSNAGGYFDGSVIMDTIRSKIASGVVFHSRFEGMAAVPEAWEFLPEPPGAYPVSLEMIGATGFRSRLFSSWLSFLPAFSVQMEVLYDSLAQ